MPEIAPFKGIIYGPDLAGDAARLICPPYDAIPPAMQQELYESSDFNAVRLELPAEPDPYAASSTRLREWLASGVLVQDGEPALYPCFQSFEDEQGVTHTRKGLFVALRLYDFAEEQVLPHERTLSGPKADRLKMFRETGANISSIFGLYADPSRQVDEAISEFAAQHEPLIDATFQGVRNRLWRVTDPALVAAAQSVLAGLKVYIADGHHRYETGLAYRNERAAANPAHTGREPYNYIMTYLANIYDEGLLILPIHRLVHGIELFEPESFIKRLDRWFTVWALPGRSALEEFLETGGSAMVFGIVLPDLVLGISLDPKPSEALSSPVPEALQSLDVVVLHDLVLGQILGISAEAMASQSNLVYVSKMGDVFDAVASGKAQVGMVLRPVRVEQVISVSVSGEAMPQKSTWFYPKVMTGMVFHSLEKEA
ncbi:hypothetical protein BIU88_00260 [Chlorobaculum limnaeum]|uniref:DUF1015 domain-containing protein n=1 Tax=Chlorobaculum limnaeum TaxID=274537 RepID=A0A1D8D1V2_CHLLM|nr:DUF1015 domain-containing protein [Chlorobaculum limnaeum]AOS82727.1 hypothetical protein BIU88_00260 [Chlorobaculum limnaeum]